MKRGAIGQALALFLLSAAACGKSADAPPPMPANQAQPAPRADKTAVKPAPKDPPVATFTEEELAKAFKADAKAILAKYVGKRLEVRGTVWMADNDNIGEGPRILLRGFWGKGEYGPEKGIHCWLPPAEEGRVDRLAERQRVRIRGVLEDNAYDPILTKCELVEVGASPAIRVGLKQLANAFKKDEKSAEREYRGKPLLVTGTVVLVEPEHKNFVYFLLKDPADTNHPPAYLVVACPSMFSEKLHARLAAVGSGQQIEVLGKVGNDLEVGFCLDGGKLLAVSGDKLTVPPGRAEAPPLAIKEEELGEELHKDPVAAWVKYARKRLEVRGVVEDADCDDFEDVPGVRLRGYQSSVAPGERERIFCRFPASMTERVEELAKGQRVKVRGVFRKVGQGFFLIHCELIDVGPSPAVRIAVPELVRAFQHDRKAAQAKYGEKAVLVEGAGVGD